jgi:subtilisin family serine protease
MSGNHAAFSGYGPSSDGRVKPDVMALGVQAAYPFADSTIRNGNGTSFSSPILCGAAACLWQAFPAASASDIRSAIIASSHLFNAPNDSMGFGIPDMRVAFRILDNSGVAHWEEQDENQELLLFPNPTSDGTIRWVYQGSVTPQFWRLWDTHGKLVIEGAIPEWTTWNGGFQGWVQHLQAPAGIYQFQLIGDNKPLTSSALIVGQ